MHVSAGTAQVLVEDVASPTPLTLAPGTSVTVKVSGGPGNETDWVGLYRVGDPDGAQLSWQYLSGTTSPPTTPLQLAALRFNLPADGGAYEFRFFAANSYAKPAVSTTVNVQVADVRITIARPVAGSQYAVGSFLLLSADVAITGATITQLDFLVDGAVVGSGHTQPYSAAWPATTPGSHEVTVAVYDSAGGVTTSSPRAVIVSTIGPSINAQVSPAANASGWYTNYATVTFSCAPAGAPIASCTSPQYVYDDARDVRIQGEASIQRAIGRRSSSS